MLGSPWLLDHPLLVLLSEPVGVYLEPMAMCYFTQDCLLQKAADFPFFLCLSLFERIDRIHPSLLKTQPSNSG